MKRGRLTLRQTLTLFVFIILMISGVATSLMYMLLFHTGVIPTRFYAHLVMMLMSIAFAVLIGTLTASWLGKYFLRPITQLRDASERVAQGYFSVRVPEDAHYPVNPVICSFNRMTRELGSMQIFRDDFIQSFSHEFKTPIVSIQGFAKQLLREDLSDDERREYATIIVEESRRLSHLSANVLRLSRLDSEETITEHSPFRLDEQLRSCILLLERQWTEKQLNLDIDLESVTVDGNFDLLSEVWLNLLTNAIKFTGNGGDIAVRLIRQEPWAVVSIRDTGIGMNQQTLDHVFEKYFRGDTLQHFDGNGLGLALAYRIIKLSGGSISAVSQENTGTTFTIKLQIST